MTSLTYDKEGGGGGGGEGRGSVLIYLKKLLSSSDSHLLCVPFILSPSREKCIDLRAIYNL